MKSPIFIIFTAIVFTIVFTACPSNEDDVVLPYPECMQSTIDSILAMPILNPPGYVEQWTHSSDTYYYVAGGCCDLFNYLYTTDCDQLCAPDGGFTGNGDGRCPAFTEEIVKITVWEDPRK